MGSGPGRRIWLVVVLAAAALVAVFGGASGRAARTGCSVTTQPATNITSTSATLNGSGSCGMYTFGYGTTGGNGYYCGPVPEQPHYDVCTAPQAATSYTATGLTPGTTYHFQFFASCDCGIGGGDLTFQTLPGSRTTPPPPPPKPPEDPHADLAVSVSADSTSANIGDTLTYTVLVRNWGPREATDVTMTDVLPAQVEFVSVSSTAPPAARRLQDACSGGSTVTCRIGVLGYGSSSTTTIVTRVVAAGDAIDTATVSNPDQPDPNGANSTGTTTVAVAPPPPTTTATVPPPVYGRTFDLRPVSGTVLVRLPGTTTFVPLTDLTSVPAGSEIDTTNGHVEITSASDAANDTQSAQFYDGRFVLLYAQPDIGTAPQVPGTVTTLVTSLVLSAPLDCAKTRHSALRQAPAKKVRFLWGSGMGNFRTRGRYAAATVRGTIWFTEDTCTTTTVRVIRGVVDVYDVVLNKHFRVHAGQSYTSHRKP